MATRTVTALFDDHDQAARAVDTVEAEGIPHADISIVASDASGGGAPAPRSEPARAQADAPHETDAADGAGAGATLGTVLGGGAGLLAGLGLLAIPGVGPVVAAGWLVAALSGAGVGAATGGLIGALTGAGLSGTDAETYAEGVRRGGTLVTVKAEDTRADRIIELLDRAGAVDLDERAQGWRAQGWTGGTVGDVPSARGEVGSTAVGAAASTTTGLDTESGHTLLPPDGEATTTGEPRTGADPTTSPATRQVPGGIR